MAMHCVFLLSLVQTLAQLLHLLKAVGASLFGFDCQCLLLLPLTQPHSVQHELFMNDVWNVSHQSPLTSYQHPNTLILFFYSLADKLFR